MSGKVKIFWVCGSGVMVDLRLLLEPLFFGDLRGAGYRNFFSSRRGSVLTSISKLKQNNFETFRDSETV